MAVLIRRLEEDDSVKAFDCGDERLNNYLIKYAWNNQQKSLIGVTYVAVDEAAPKAVLGYFTLATSSVARDALPKKMVRGLPRYDLPMILLARLAVDHRFSGRGLGRALLRRALDLSLSVSEQVGCRCIIVDAYPTAIDWYKRFGFTTIEGSAETASFRMYLDIRTVGAARESGPARQ